ncbi:MAG: HAMP domain-containing protein [bacterium]|nr:HAMP domain-containing protein [bacterium]
MKERLHRAATRRIRNLGILGKLVVFISITLLLCFVCMYTIFWVSFGTYTDYVTQNTRTLLMDRYEAEIKSTTEVAVTLISAINMLEGLSNKQKIELSRKLIRPLRFGTDGYFFVYREKTGINIIHGTTPELEGKKLWNLQSPDKKNYIIQDLDRVAREKKVFHQYYWTKPESAGLHKKLGSALSIPGTNMWVGTGTYLDEIDTRKAALSANEEEIARNLNIRYLVSFAGCATLALIIIIFIAKNLSRPIKELIYSAREISGGKYDINIKTNTRDEIGKLATSFNEMAKTLKDLTENLETRVEDRTLELQDTLSKLNESNGILQGLSDKLSRYLSPQIKEQIFAGKQDVTITSSRKKLTVFFSDIRNFTQTTERLETESLTELLNNYLDEMSHIALKHGGTIDKFIGDAILAFFGDPESRGHENDALAAVSMAIEMRERLTVLQKKWFETGQAEPFHVRMGLNTGFCTVGNFGSNERMDYTIIGGQVNLASRLESSAEPNTILISHETYSLIKDQIYCVKGDTITVKGISYPIITYKVINFRDKLKEETKLFDEQREGFAFSVDLTALSVMDKQEISTLLREAINTIDKCDSCTEQAESANGVNVRDLLDRIKAEIQDTALDKNITLSHYLLDDCIILNSEQEEAGEIITDFILHAIMSSPENGEVNINAWLDGGFVKISITDQGDSIDKKKIKDIFSPQYSDAVDLSKTKEIIKKLKGTITVKSLAESGNSFTVSLPGAVQ